MGAPTGGGAIGGPDGGEPPPWPPPFGLPPAFEFDNIARKAATAADRVVEALPSLEDVEVVVAEPSDVEADAAVSLAFVDAEVACAACCCNS